MILVISAAAALLTDGVTAEMSAGAFRAMVCWAVVNEILLRSGRRRKSR